MYVMDRNPARCIIFVFIIYDFYFGLWVGGNAGKPLCGRSSFEINEADT